MSSDYFKNEQLGTESFNEQSFTNEQGSGDRTERKTDDIRLQDIEEQLDMAESRCNTLKSQLDYMKQVYGVGRNGPPKSRKISNVQDRTSEVLDDSTSADENSKNIPLRSAVVSRQTSNAIGTDNTGAAVRTINNILNGITNSVNRLSEIHSQITTPRIKVISTGVDTRNGHLQEEIRKSEKGVVETIQKVRTESTGTLTIKSRGHKRKIKSANTSSQHAIKKTSRIDKKMKSALFRSTVILEKQSAPIVRNRYFNKLNAKSNRLVEIYHNDAVKHSDSDESNLKKSRQQQERKSDGDNGDTDGIPPLNIQSLNQDIGPQVQSAKTDKIYQNFVNNHYYDDPPEAPRTTLSCYSRNYELPTVASRMKQVAKSYMMNLNIKTIPFCAAISTTQSHNIGINIQQVMNIIKNRQPVNGISPTLAHNIGLAAEKLNNKPFSTLISTINSKIAQSASRCPLSRAYLNIQQLQEQAKNVSEDIIEEADEEADSPQTQTMIITGPSGDMKVKTKKTPLWSIDQNASNDQCTCVSQTANGFPHVDHRYQRNSKTFTENTTNSQMIDNRPKSRIKRYRATKTNTVIKNPTTPQEIQVQPFTSCTNNAETHKVDICQGNEKSLKEVLTNLHADFEALNRKYEDLSEKSVGAGNEETIKELEKLETELTKKEDEITMVMSLYKEVLALKQQVRLLKEKKSQASIPPKEPKNMKIKFEEYNNPEAAFHLTKLLRQIQHYQMRYKTNLREE